MSHREWRLYFDWLCELVDVHEQTLYWYDILWSLQATEFEIRHPKDSNRVEDARDLRNEFRGLFGASRGIYEYPYGVFEVLVALARRGEWEIMHDPELGDRTSEWFWTMMNNLGLQKYAYYGALDDPKCDLEVMKIIENFVQRRYSRTGFGNIFENKSGQIDFRKEELWNQMCFYFDQFF